MEETTQKNILIIKGVLNEKKLESINDFDGTIIVRGKTTFKSDVTIPCDIILIGSLEATKLVVKGSLICESSCEVDDLYVDGDLSIVQKDTCINNLTLNGKLKSTVEDILL